MARGTGYSSARVLRLEANEPRRKIRPSLAEHPDTRGHRTRERQRGDPELGFQYGGGSAPQGFGERRVHPSPIDQRLRRLLYKIVTFYSPLVPVAYGSTWSTPARPSVVGIVRVRSTWNVAGSRKSRRTCLSLLKRGELRDGHYCDTFSRRSSRSS